MISPKMLDSNSTPSTLSKKTRVTQIKSPLILQRQQIMQNCSNINLKGKIVEVKPLSTQAILNLLHELVWQSKTCIQNLHMSSKRIFHRFNNSQTPTLRRLKVKRSNHLQADTVWIAWGEAILTWKMAKIKKISKFKPKRVIYWAKPIYFSFESR